MIFSLISICLLSFFPVDSSSFEKLPNTPPGTIRVNDLWVDKSEIANIHWLEFLHYTVEEFDSLELEKYYPSQENFWYDQREFYYMPVVYISYEQAVAYCEWRSRVVNEKFGTNIRYRLPSATEWKAIAETTLEKNKGRINREKKEYIKSIEMDSTQYSVISVTWKEEKFLAHLFGNVSEMTAEKGVAMGGNNFKLQQADSSLHEMLLYKGPHPYLGFRCVVDVSDAWSPVKQ